MHRFGSTSESKLDTCHPTLEAIARRALQFSPYDFSITHGYRGQEIQDALFSSGASTKEWPNSKHNNRDEHRKPMSLAIDFAPYVDGRIPWDETHIFAAVAGCLFAAAQELGTKLRWGGDWDGDGNTKEHRLQDWGHVELVLDWS